MVSEVESSLWTGFPFAYRIRVSNEWLRTIESIVCLSKTNVVIHERHPNQTQPIGDPSMVTL